jgi:hypothetical protein
MPKSEQIRVMISSRCKARIPFEGKSVWLTALRERLKEEIESLAFWPGQQALFDCWINEPSSGSEISETWWERSLNESKQADIVIVLYNGESGGAIKNGPMGICHAELDAVLTDSKKVRVVRLPLADLPKEQAQLGRDEAFRAYVDNLDMFASPVNSGEELIERVRQEIRDVVVTLVQNAATTPDLSKSNIGPALEWHRMSYAARESAMRAQVRKVLKDIPGTKPGKLRPSEGEWMTMWLWLGGKRILAALHAVPAGLSQSAAREIVGQPFLMDHTLHGQLAAGDGGPIHLVACYKGATESQALKMLGFPDATVVPGRFGLHVADSVQKIQIVLLRNCQSPTATTHAISTWLEWLKRSSEDVELAKRAAARKRIIDAIAEVNQAV